MPLNLPLFVPYQQSLQLFDLVLFYIQVSNTLPLPCLFQPDLASVAWSPFGLTLLVVDPGPTMTRMPVDLGSDPRLLALYVQAIHTQGVDPHPLPSIKECCDTQLSLTLVLLSCPFVPVVVVLK